MIIYHFAGRGVFKAGVQHLVLNEFDPDTSFYKLLDVEERIRQIAERHLNSYNIAIFDCSRELYDHVQMSGKLTENVSATNSQEKIRQSYLSSQKKP